MNLNCLKPFLCVLDLIIRRRIVWSLILGKKLMKNRFAAPAPRDNSANMLSTRPPPPLSSSMEVIPKRYRSGSISSRLRSASELFDEGVIVDRQQKGVLKDLIISGDETLAEALSRYERGDKEPFQKLLQSGLLNRKSSLDLLGDVGDLSFDFLSVSATSNALSMRANLDAPFPMDDDELTLEILLQESSDAFGKSPPKKFLTSAGSFSSRAQMGLRSASLSSIPGSHPIKPAVATQKAHGSQAHGPNASAFASLGSPPPDLFEISILDESGLGAWAHPAFRGGSSFSSMRAVKEVLEFDSDDLESPPSSPMKDSPDSLTPKPAPRSGGSTVAPLSLPKSRRQASQTKASKNESGSASATSAPIVIPRPSKAGAGARAASTPASTTKRSAAAAPNTTPTAAPTAQTAEERAASRRAQGVPMIGAYSPESRKIRVERFVAKRDRRVWKKKVKYDVRKNFADSRLRVKGRFVKKEDEEMLRDLMTMV